VLKPASSARFTVFQESAGVGSAIPKSICCSLPWLSDSNLEQVTRQSIRLAAALSNKRIRVDRTPDGNFAAVLIDGPKPNRLPVTEIRIPLDEKPTDDAEAATSVLDERETETANLTDTGRHPHW